MIAATATARHSGNHVRVELHDDSGRFIDADLRPSTALKLAQELAAMSDDPGAPVTARWGIGLKQPVDAALIAGTAVLKWGDQHRNQLRVNPSRLREIADLLHGLADESDMQESA